MRVSRTPLALAALLFVTACGSPAGLLAPEGTAASSAASEDGGGAGLMGSGNSVSSDTADDGSSTSERGTIGLLGSGNRSSAEAEGESPAGVGQFGSGN